MSKRLVNNIYSTTSLKNNIFIDNFRGLSIRENASKAYNYNTVYYFDKLIKDKYNNIKTNNEESLETNNLLNYEEIIDETPEPEGEQRWL